MVDRVIKAVMLVLASAPAFWFGLVILAVFSGWLGWLPSGLSAPAGVAAADVQGVDRLRHLILPALTLALVGMPQIVLHTREKTIDVMARPYARFAQARGYSRAQVAWRHGVVPPDGIPHSGGRAQHQAVHAVGRAGRCGGLNRVVFHGGLHTQSIVRNLAPWSRLPPHKI